MNWRKVFSLAGLLVLLLAAVPFGAFAAPGAQDALAKVEPLVLQELAASGQTDYFIWMTEKADLSQADAFNTKIEKGRFVYETLVATAARTQKDLRSYLDRQGASYRPYYIVNAILVKGGSHELLMNLAARPDVSKITANHKYQLEVPFKSPDQGQTDAIESNITFVKAPQVWALGITGQGTVVAGNDTGIDETHPAIARHYRGCLNPPTCSSYDHNYNWWDATGTYPTDPWDGFGHGTHTTGTMVGDDGAGNQIGMAPGAQTIHCKNMTDGGSGDDAGFIECFEWDLAPWDLNHANPRPDLAPDAVNNSWGYSGGGQNQFRTAIDNLQAAGTVVEVSAGNEGSSCGSLRSPGDYLEVITTGSIQHTAPYPGTITGFSSRGPSSLDGNYFPDVMAPGENIRSSVPGGGFEGGWSGTSMAGPHVTALVGLIWSANPALRGQVALTLQIIKDTAVPLTGQGGSNCGGDYTNGPNNDWGYGTIDALAAVQAAVAIGGAGHLSGTATDSVTTLPIEGAAIAATHELGFRWDAVTDASGFYTMTVAAGTFTVTAEAFGYYPEVDTGVVVVTDGVTVEDFSLDPLPTYVISGTVSDAGTGAPLAAVVTVVGTPLAPVPTDPTTGFYSVTVPTGAYTMNVTAAMHAPVDRQVVADHDQTQDFALYGFCNVFTDTVENGNIGWTAGGTPNTWAITTENSHSPSHSWTDSPGGDYSNYNDNYISSPVFDLSDYTGMTLKFWHIYATEVGYDYCIVEYSTNGGGTWNEVTSWNGTNSGWEYVELPIPQLDGQANARIRFHFTSDVSIVYDGWHVDDISLTGGGPGCGGDVGLVTGQVTHVYYGTPIEGASVTATPVLAGAGTNATTDPNGYYTLTLAAGTYDITAQKADYTTAVVTGVVVTTGTTVVDFALDSAVAAVTPPSLHAYVTPSGTTTLTLNIANPGGLDLSFAIAETTATLPLRYVGQDVTVHVPAIQSHPGAAARVPAVDQPARDFTMHVGWVSPESINVLLVTPDVVGAGDITLLLTTLAAFPDLVVTLWDGNAGTPTVADMQAYDVVFVGNDILWTSSAIDKVALSNNLADYIDAGGKVLASSFVWSYDDWGFGAGGRFIDEDYGPYEIATTDFWDPIALGTFDPAHPIMAGITNVTEGYNHQDPALSPNGTWVASWTDATNFVAVAPNCVGLNALYFNAAIFGGQAGELLHNALLFLMGGGAAADVPWVSEAPVSGTVPAGTDLDVDVIFTAIPPYNVVGESYTATLVLSHNDPVYPDDILVPITMTVVNCIPVQDANFAWAPLSPFAGDTVVFTGTASGGEPITYTWDFGDGGTDSGANVSHVYAAAGIYTVTLTAANACPSEITVVYQITVQEPPCPPVEANFTWAPTMPVVDEVVTFYGVATSTAPIVSYEWVFGDTAMGSGAIVTHTYAATGTYTVILTATNDCGEFAVVSYDVTVAAPPPCDDVQIITATYTPAGCTVTFTVELTGTEPFTYLWDFGAFGTFTGASPVVDFQATGTYTGTLQVWNCVSGHATRDLSVTVACTPPVVYYYVYLPVVFKAGP
jgi:PKD repeat protein/subtilisin family serine protease